MGNSKEQSHIIKTLKLKKRLLNGKGGVRKMPEYISWLHMKSRCFNEKRKDFKHYGGRGITVCGEWINSFVTFLDDVGFKPTPKHTLDRVDVNGNYTKENVRWANLDVQMQNKRTTNESGYRGLSRRFPKGKWYGGYQVLYGRKYLGYSHDVIEAAEIYDRYAYFKLGDMAKLNFPNNKEKYKKEIANAKTR